MVSTLAEALEEPHFRERRLFDERVGNRSGCSIPALPVPVVPSMRARGGQVLSAPALGERAR